MLRGAKLVVQTTQPHWAKALHPYSHCCRIPSHEACSRHDRRSELIDLRVERLDGRGLLLARRLVRAKLRVAPALVLGLLVRLLHEADDEVLTGASLLREFRMIWIAVH